MFEKFTLCKQLTAENGSRPVPVALEGVFDLIHGTLDVSI
jgi:hypothetical protein